MIKILSNSKTPIYVKKCVESWIGRIGDLWIGGVMKILCGFEMLNCDNDIEQIIKKYADNPLDDIWISGENEYSCLAILVTRELACIHYFTSEEEHYQSVGNEESDGTTKFYAGGEMAEYDPKIDAPPCLF